MNVYFITSLLDDHVGEQKETRWVGASRKKSTYQDLAEVLIRDVGQLRAVELGNHELCAAVSYMRLSDMNPRRWREKGGGGVRERA